MAMLNNQMVYIFFTGLQHVATIVYRSPITHRIHVCYVW